MKASALTIRLDPELGRQFGQLRSLDSGNAEAAGADILITGDEDLLSIAGEASIGIASPRAFWELLRSGTK